MTEKNHRVLARKGARYITQDEMSQVGGFGTPVLMTETLTFVRPLFPPDHFFDEKAE